MKYYVLMHVIVAVRNIVIAVILVSFLGTSASFAHAGQGELGKTALIERIEELFLQVQALQERLSGLQDSSSNETALITYKTKFYTGTYESLYTVEDTSLLPQKGEHIRSGDRLIWNTFIEIAGATLDDINISEFRVYNDTNSEVSAFIEEKPDHTWILGFNREGENLADIYKSGGVVDLLLHEYGHIVFFTNEAIQDDFEDAFWKGGSRTTADYVSAYAATNATEDIAESFVHFVVRNKPDESGTRYEKIRFFYEYPEMVGLRTALRTSELF